jgi:hypothetical protein
MRYCEIPSPREPGCFYLHCIFLPDYFFLFSVAQVCYRYVTGVLKECELSRQLDER